MVREVITINVGRCGIQMGHRIWKQYCAEADIESHGNRSSSSDDQEFKSFFRETNDGKYRARNLMVDTDRNVIENVMKCSFSAIYDEECLSFGNEGANNNFAKAYYRLGPKMMDNISHRLNRMVEDCGNLSKLIINHSVGGGTGSGLASLILEIMSVDFRKKCKLGFEVISSPMISDCVVEPYNALLTTHRLLDHTDVSVILDNEALYGICRNKLDIEARRMTYNSFNELIAKTASSITAPLRFEREIYILDEFQTNLVPFPRLHFMITSMAPMSTEQKKESTHNNGYSVRHITESCLSSENFFVKIDDFNIREDKYMAITVNYRENVKAKEANATVSWMKTNMKVCFVEWCPTGFKLEFNETPPAKIVDDVMAEFERNAVMIGNNAAISRVFSERIRKKYDMMYSQRAFVHWYVEEGMEEGEFAEAREDLKFLEMDYLDVLSEQLSDEEDCDSEY